MIVGMLTLTLNCSLTNGNIFNMTHKEFYVWLDGYLTGKLGDTHIAIGPIVEKMKEVKDNVDQPIIKRYDQIPVPVNPVIRTVEPYSPSWDITCKNKK
jgi:hypothetical protein